MQCPKNISLDRLRFADHVRPHDVIGWPQGPGEPLALTEALVAQRADLTKPTLFFGLSSSDTLRPELAEHFAFRALNGAGTNRRVTALADIVPCHVSSIPALLRSGELRVDVVLIQVKPLPGGGFTLGVIADFTQALIQQARVVIALVNPSLPATRGDAFVADDDIDVLVESDDRLIDMPDPEPSAGGARWWRSRSLRSFPIARRSSSESERCPLRWPARFRVIASSACTAASCPMCSSTSSSAASSRTRTRGATPGGR